MLNSAKEAAAIAALNFIHDGMAVGLGTGSTASFFISHLGKKCRNGLNIRGVPTSSATEQQAKQCGIPLIDIDAIDTLDVAVDGADEIDPLMRLIKGGGGASVREKIIASRSRQFIVIADHTKKSDFLGKFPLAVEILRFGAEGTIKRLQETGYPGTMRLKNGIPYVTENGNLICDLQLPYPCRTPEKDEQKIRNVIGVIDTGFFIGMASTVIIGFPDHQIEIQTR